MPADLAAGADADAGRSIGVALRGVQGGSATEVQAQSSAAAASALVRPRAGDAPSESLIGWCCMAFLSGAPRGKKRLEILGRRGSYQF